MNYSCTRPIPALLAVASLTLLLGSNARAAATYPATILADGPLAYYRFSEAGVTTAPYPLAANLGSLGAAANGTDTSSSAEPAIGKGAVGALADPANTAFSFPGTANTRVVVPWQTGLAYNGPFTIEFWAKPASTAFSSPGAMMKYWTSGTGCEDAHRYGWLIYQSDTDLNLGNGWQIRLYKGSGTTAAGIAQANMAIVPGTWYHVVFVYTGSRVQLFVNGALLDDEAASGYKAPPFSAYAMNWGSRGYSGSTSYWEYSGLLDEMAFYTNVLSSAEIATHYGAAATNAAGYPAMVLANHPPGYWRCNEVFNPPVASNSGSGASALDSQYRDWCTTTAGLQPPACPGLDTTNQVLLLDSSRNGFVRIPPLNTTLTSATFECLLKRSGTQQNTAGIVLHRNGNTTHGLSFQSDGEQLAYNWNNAANTWQWNSGLVPPDGAWAYAALTVQPDRATMYLYDGTNWMVNVNYATHGAASFNARTLIGWDSLGTRFFNGALDEVALYSKALSEGQLHTHALAAFGASGPPAFATESPTVSPTDIFAGSTFTLTIDAYGQPPLFYQWQHGDSLLQTNLPGATNSTYVKTSANDLDSGYYNVILTSAGGSVTSSMAYVYVYPSTPPTITQDPQPRSVFPGGNCTLAATAEGPALHYQWKHAGTNLPGATTAMLTLTNINSAKTGDYLLLVTNLAGSASSAAAAVALLPTPANSYTASIVADRPEAYWRLNEASGPTILDSMGRHDGTLSGAVTVAQTGVLSGDEDTCMTFAGGYVLVPYSPDLNPTNFTVECWGRLDNVPFPLGANDYYAPVSSRDGNYDGDAMRKGYNLYADSDGHYDFWLGRGPQWEVCVGAPIQTNAWKHFVCIYDGYRADLYVNGVLTGTSYATLLPNVRKPFYIGSILDSGPYPWKGAVDEVVFYKSALAPARVQLHYQLGLYGTNSSPVFIQGPASQTVQVGAAAAFNATLAGATPMTYQWLKDATPIPGAITNALTFARVDYTNAGQYTLAVTNSFGGAVSAAASLVVAPPASVTNLTCRISPTATGPRLELIWPLNRTLYSTTNLVAGPWTTVSGAAAPYYRVPLNPQAGPTFFKVQ